jgi:hypothetical protein
METSMLLTAFGEESLEDGGAFGVEDAGGDFDLMIESRVGKDFETGADRAALGIVGAVDKSRDAGVNHGPSAHGAGLDSDVQRGIREAVVAEDAGGFAKNDDFCMGRWVVVADGAIAGTGENPSVVNEDSANGHFAGGRCSTRFGNGFLHELDVSFHFEPENIMWKERINTPTRSGQAPDTESAEIPEKTGISAEKQSVQRMERKEGLLGCLTI